MNFLANHSDNGGEIFHLQWGLYIGLSLIFVLLAFFGWIILVNSEFGKHYCDEYEKVLLYTYQDRSISTQWQDMRSLFPVIWKSFFAVFFTWLSFMFILGYLSRIPGEFPLSSEKLIQRMNK